LQPAPQTTAGPASF